MPYSIRFERDGEESGEHRPKLLRLARQYKFVTPLHFHF